MLALSIRQPWAWLILHAGKNIENRNWPTAVRGRVLVHAAKGCTAAEFENADLHCVLNDLPRPPALDLLARGGIVGSVEVVDCVKAHPSPWFAGSYGFVLRDPKPASFVVFRGQLGFFDVPNEIACPLVKGEQTGEGGET